MTFVHRPGFWRAVIYKIPRGHVSTYKAMSDALRSSPRAVGQALKLNPFAPLPVPCHRVIATSLAIGGFSGGSGDCENVADKRAKLIKEGCRINNYYEFEANVDGTKDIFVDFKL
ncbi:6-O-methylguanine DNA methyltransferase [Dichotomocladium elegans]|nr:6-O-methylguanine DNA methyltransferase [Dichotomocladium elegans]